MRILNTNYFFKNIAGGNSLKSITFILPTPSLVPNGGYRIVYEYANKLVKSYRVNIVYSVTNPYHRYRKFPYMPLAFRYLIVKLLFYLKCNRWHNLNHLVKERVVYAIKDDLVLYDDIVIATFWSTAYSIDFLKNERIKKYYFIQHFETWAGESEFVKNSYLLNVNKIVIAKWLKDEIHKLGGKAEIVPNGLDFNELKVNIEPAKRVDLSILMMYHEAEWKGSNEGVEVLKILKNQYSDLQVTFFSVFKKNRKIPDWIKYIHNPTREELVALYNDHAIFFCTSWIEGFGLPGAEALACGCALVTTDNKGCREYAKNGETALIVQPRNIDEMVSSLKKLLENRYLRISLAEKGIKYIKKFSWDKSILKLENILNS